MKGKNSSSRKWNGIRYWLFGGMTWCFITDLSAQSAMENQSKQPLISPWVIGHRGASGYLPEHTLAAYTLAAQQGADFIEPDLVPTRDGVLVARHENEIGSTTNVEDVFPGRKTSKVIDGDMIEGWFTEDFTLAELRQLRARERLPFRNHASDDLYGIPTLEEIIATVKHLSDSLNRKIGIIPEIKHSTYFNGLGIAVEDTLLKVLDRQQLPSADIPVMIQSFEVSNLRYLHARSDIPLLQLLDEPEKIPYDLRAVGQATAYQDMLTPEGLTEIATYARAIGPPKWWLLVTAQQESKNPVSPVIEMAHAAGLEVIAYTFRKEADFVYPSFEGDVRAEIGFCLQLGLDGLFTDFPDTGVLQRNVWIKEKNK